MRSTLLVMFVLAAPAVAQDVAEQPSQPPMELPVRRIDGLMEVFLPATPTAHKAARPYASEVTLQVMSDVSAPTDPFTSTGNGAFTLVGTGLGVHIDTRPWYLDVGAQLLDRSLRQRYLTLTVERHIATVGPVDIGLETDYWELGFRHRTLLVVDTELSTQRQGRAVMAGPSWRFAGPGHTELTVATLAGWYANRYDSVVAADNLTLLSPLVNDQLTIGGARFALRSPVVARRLVLYASVRYFRLWGARSSWTPGSEWSGETALDVRMLSVRKRSLFLGATARLGPAGPGLVTDTAFGLRIKWKLR